MIRLTAMIPYSEQLLLLSIDTVTGRQFPVSEKVISLSLAGALLFDASFGDLINDDWKQLTVLKADESGNVALDETIRCLLFVEGSIPLCNALGLVAAHSVTLQKMVLDSMIDKGLLVRKKRDIIEHTNKQDFYSPDLSQVLSIHKQIRNAIINEPVPDFNIPPLVSLMVSCGLTKYIFNQEEIITHKKKFDLLAGMESLGREIITTVKSLENSNLETSAAKLIGLKHDQPKIYAGGMDAVLNSLSYLYKETGISKSRKIISNLNQVCGFECPGCAWPNPDKNRSRFEFCENGAKNVSAEATTNKVSAEFFKNWSVQDLLMTSGYWLEQQGRLTEPMYLEKEATHYMPISWEDAFKIVAEELNLLNSPDEAVFYASGRTSNEAAFVYQLFARSFGTNNLPNSANLCHEPSGKALSISLGFGKSSVTLNDFPKADCIFVFGHNPGSNHPRMLSSLQSAVRKGCRIIAVNPMPEASLIGFANPQEASTYLGKQTKLAHLYIQPIINGDLALVRGIAKALFEKDEITGNIIDYSFINKYTSDFDDYRKLVLNTSWDLLVSNSGVDKKQILEAAEIYNNANNTISTWCLGITHHKNSIETIREIINLMLLKGNIGRSGAGVCPVRGHSNIQGLRTSGVGENMPLTFLESLDREFNINVPKTPGMSVVPAIKSMYEGKVKVLISLGGNLASAVPDTEYTEQALRKCNLTVMISTKLNRSHFVTGKRALILPCLSRTDEDFRQGVRQYSTVEDAMCKIGFTQGCLTPCSHNLKSEVSIVSGLAAAALKKSSNIDWLRLESDNSYVRLKMSRTISAFNDINNLKPSTQGYYLDNPLKKRIFQTSDNKAHFSNSPVEMVISEPNELLLMTIRSHDQFNTSIFGLNDRYRGISNERRVIFMNRDDMLERNIAPEQVVSITSNYNDKLKKLEGYYAIPYPISKGCTAAYFPETNILTSINNVNVLTNTPAFKSIRINVNAV